MIIARLMYWPSLEVKATDPGLPLITSCELLTVSPMLVASLLALSSCGWIMREGG